MRQLGSVLAASALVAGCLLNNTSPPPRYFAPGSVTAQGKDYDPAEAGDGGVPIQLRTVHGTSFLRESIVWRSSSVEYGQYRDRLWSELPATYVQRALAAALRHTGLRLTDDAKAPALRVDVLAFDEVLLPTHAATVSLAASLRGANGTTLLDNTFTADSPIAGDDPAAMADAMGVALDDASAAVAAAVAAAVHAH